MKACRSFCAILIILAAFGEWTQGAKNPRCPGDLATVPIDVPVQLIFAGHTPLFMRTKDWRMESLAKKLNKVSASAYWRTRSTLLETFGCPVVYCNYKYTPIFASQEISVALDRVLKSALQKSGSKPLPAEELADQFESLLPNLVHDGRSYNILIYSPIFTSSEADYGYYATVNGALGSIGISNQKRFLFLDVSARPFAFEMNQGPAPGELLFTVSRNMTAYAQEMHNFLFNKITPLPDGDSSFLKDANVINFKTHVVDADAIVAQERLVGRANYAKQPPPIFFDQKRFETLVDSVVQNSFFKNGYHVHFEEDALEAEEVLVMALSRAIQSTTSEIIVNGESLADDIFTLFSKLFTPTSNAELIIPVFVLSFADATRKVRFGDGTHAYTSSGDKAVILTVENRLHPESFHSADAALFSAQKALEVLFLIRPETLALPGTEKSAFSQTVIDIAARNYVTRELRRSAATGFEKALSALNYTGYDEVAVTHLKVDFIEKRRFAVRRKLASLLRGCSRLIGTLQKEQLRARSAELLAATQNLSEKMVQVVCKKLVTDDILRDVQAAKSLVSPNIFSLCLLLVALLGFAMGYRGIHDVVVQVYRRKSGYELPQQTPARSTSESTTGQWFSTLQMSKSKRS